MAGPADIHRQGAIYPWDPVTLERIKLDESTTDLESVDEAYRELASVNPAAVEQQLALDRVPPLAEYPVIYNTFSGADIVATILVPNEKSDLTLGDLQTISYSIHRENTPVRVLGNVNPAGFVRGPRCLPASERVLIKDKGYISIADVEKGDFVQSSGKTFDMVLGSYYQGFKDCFRLSLGNGHQLIASFDHPIFTDSGWIYMKDLQPDKDKVFVASTSPSVKSDYGVSDNIIKMVALMLGDGHARIYGKPNGPKEHRLSLCIANSERGTIGNEVDRILSEMDIPFRDYKDSGASFSRSISVCLNGYAKTDWRLRRHNELHKWFKKLDLYGRKAHTKSIPNEFISGLSDRQVAVFLRYLFSIDGRYAIGADKKHIEAQYASVSEDLIDTTRLLLLRLGIPSLKHKESKKDKVGGIGTVVSKHDVYTLVISSSLHLLRFIDRIGIFGKDDRIEPYIDLLRSRINRSGIAEVSSESFLIEIRAACERSGIKLSSIKQKYNIYNKTYNHNPTPKRALKIAKAIGDDQFTDMVNSWIDNLISTTDKYQQCVVKSVEPVGCLPVYDLEVENRHAFIAENIKVHNTIAGSLIFTQFDEYTFYRLTQFREQMKHDLFPLADMIPPFDIILTFANEVGRVSKMKIFGVTIVDEGGTMSVDDLMVENTYTYMARGIQPLISYIPEDFELWPNQLPPLTLGPTENVITFRG